MSLALYYLYLAFLMLPRIWPGNYWMETIMMNAHFIRTFRC